MEGTAEEIQKQIEERISQLPADIQHAIFASDFGEKIQAEGAVNKLHVDQIQELNDNTMLLMLGFMNEDEYQKETSSLVGGDAALTQKLTSDVNQQILLPLRESMKAFAAGLASPQAPVVPSTPPARPSLASVLPITPVSSTPIAPASSTPAANPAPI